MFCLLDVFSCVVYRYKWSPVWNHFTQLFAWRVHYQVVFGNWHILWQHVAFFLPFVLWRAPQQMLRTHRSLEAYGTTLWWRWLVFLFVFPCNGAPVEWNWQDKTEVLGEKPVPVPFCTPQIPHGQNWDFFFPIRGFSPLIHFCTVWILSSFMSLYVPYYRPYIKHNTNIHAPGGIRTHDPSKRAAVDQRPRPRGHWDRHGIEPGSPRWKPATNRLSHGTALLCKFTFRCNCTSEQTSRWSMRL